MSVRRATKEDIAAIVTMGERYCREDRKEEPAADHIEAHVRAMMSAESVIVLVATDKDGGVIGTAMYMVHPDPLTGKMTCLKVHLYVLPEHRGHGIALMREAEHWANAQGATELIGSASDERAACLMRALGYEALETKFRKRLNGH